MKIDPLPSRAPAFDPNDARYWDETDLAAELHRAFEICHSCRMCVSYCGAFPDLFARVDRDIEQRGAEGAERLAHDDFRAVTELCWQCKLCYIDCPYTPDQGHKWLLDIPRLLMREKAQHAKRNGVTLQDAALGEPGKLGELSSGPFAALTNFVNESRLLRKVNARVLGISEEFPLPPFAPQRFATWLDKHEPLPGAGDRGTVAIFATCLGDFNFPRIAASAVRVLEKNGYAVERPPQQCCGLPNLDGGDVDAARAKARYNVAQLMPYVEAGQPIVIPGPSCAYTVRKEWPELLGTDDASRVAAASMDLMEFFDKLRKDGTLVREFDKPLGKIAYHAACHLRAQKIGTPGARVLGLVQDTEVEIIAKCSAVDGTWGMKAQHYEMGRKYAKKLVDGIDAADAAIVVTDCPLSGQRIRAENGVAPLHPAEALARAYGVELGASP